MKKSALVKLAPVYVLVLLSCLAFSLLADRAVTAFSEAATVRRCVIIDAGHGGEDGGTTSCTGVLESTLNLEIALRLDDLLHLLGIDTYMLRTTDTALHTQGTTIAARKVSDLKERVRIVNAAEHALLLSIHQNYFSDSRYSGPQVFYAKTDGSKELAQQTQSLLHLLGSGSDRQCKLADGVYLMQHVTCPAILVECGFLSNPDEEARLRSAAYQKKLCCALAAACSEYLQTEQ